MKLIVHKHFPWRVMWLTVAVCLAPVGIGVGALWNMQQTVPLPDSIRKQVTFPVLLPTKFVTIDEASYKFEPTQKILSFTGRLQDGQAVTFTEQTTPAPFADIPNYYPQFLQTLYEYQAFDSLQGTVHMTHPKNAGQVVVLNTKGTLLFARVARDEPQDIWRQIINNLRVYQLQ